MAKWYSEGLIGNVFDEASNYVNMRSEEGITRGSLTNGIRFQPELTVIRAIV